jgi:rhodanese-related sulfurtransferase
MRFSTPSIAMTATTATRESLLDAAAARRDAGQLPYFGALTPQETAALLAADPRARLVDVRTRAELDWVGTPDVAPDQFVHVEWNQYPGGVRNPSFLDVLEAAVPRDAPVLFLCRSAARSKHAAMAAAQAGYKLAMDVLEGFEGAKDTEGHRKTVEGWCFRGLPWHGA